MSKKNLSRTVIEGGRYGRNKWERRHSHADVRAKLKNYLADVMKDIEVAEEEDVEPLEPVYQGFKDKLSPMYRWLRKQVSRAWDDVRSEITEKFDTRTTAGRHIVFDHLLKSVQIGKEEHRYYYRGPYDDLTSGSDNDYYVDDEGTLQKKLYTGRRYRADKIPEFDTKKLVNWLSGRIVGKVGTKYFWFSPTGKAKKHRYGGHAHIWKITWGRPRSYYDYGYATRIGFEYLTYEPVYKVDSLGFRVLGEDGAPIELERKAVWKSGATPTLRQDRKLNQKEMDFWNTVPEYYQTKILEESPTYPPEKLKEKYGRPRY